MERAKSTARNTEKQETQYGRIWEICYWGRHYIYKDYIENCIHDKNTEEIGTNIEKEISFAPIRGDLQKNRNVRGWCHIEEQ